MTEVKLTIPENWTDITIGEYQEYIKIQDSNQSDKKKIINSLCLLCKTKPSIVNKIAYKDLLQIMDILKRLIDTEPDKQKFKKRFMFKDDKYGFVPNLSNITTGEYIDLETFCKKPIENLHIIMSILYRKVTFERNERYAIAPYNPDEFKEELFKDCPMDIALSSLGFFLNLGEQLAKISVNYLKQLEMKQRKA